MAATVLLDAPAITQTAGTPVVVSRGRTVRWPEIDLLKAVSILAVVMVHSINDRLADYESGVETLLGNLTRFAVPAFFFAAGFLFDKGDASTATVLRKTAGRIVPPYLACSLAILAFEVVTSAPVSLRLMAARLVLGETSGIYYFVFVLGYLYAVSLWLRRCPRGLVYALWAAEAAAFVWFYLAWPSFLIPSDPAHFWRVLLRNPVIHLLPYLTGWVVSLHYEQIRPRLARWALPLAVGALLGDVAALSWLQRLPSFGPAAAWRELIVAAHAYLILLGILSGGIVWWRVDRAKALRALALTSAKHRGTAEAAFAPATPAARNSGHTPGVVSRLVLRLSECSYGIFLVHLMFVQAAHRWFRPVWDEAFPERIVLTWLAGLLGSAAVIAAARWTFGRRSRHIIGA